MNASRLWASRGQGPYPKSSLFSPCTPSLRDLIHPMASTTTCMPRTLSAGLSPACHGPALQPSRVAGCRMLCWTPPGHQNPTCPVSSEPTLAPGSGALFRQSKAQILLWTELDGKKCLHLNVKQNGELIKLLRHRELVHVKHTGWKMEKCFWMSCSLWWEMVDVFFGTVLLSKSLAVNLYYFYNQQKYLIRNG